MNEKQNINERLENLENTVRELQIKVDQLLKNHLTGQTPQQEVSSEIFSKEYYQQTPGTSSFFVEYKNAEGKGRREFVFANNLSSIKQRIESKDGVFIRGWVATEKIKPEVSSHNVQPHRQTIKEKIKSEDVLNNVGLGLLLLGLAFFFKYAVDQGWLTPALRIGFGFILGTFLLVSGLWIGKLYQNFSKVLQGGSVATYYITVFAAFQLYHLFSYPFAFLLMGAVTLLAFGLSIQQSTPALSIIATIGGLCTPFVLYTGSQNISGLVLYTCLILFGTSVIYYFRGWKDLIIVSAPGAWLVLLVGYFTSTKGKMIISLSDQVVLQLGIIFIGLLSVLFPIVHEILLKKKPHRWFETSYENYENSFFYKIEHILSISTPFIAVLFSKEVWGLSTTILGWISIGTGIVYLFLFFALKKLKLMHAYIHLLIALFLATFAFTQLFEGKTLYLVLACEATMLHFIAYRYDDRILTALAHSMFAVLCLWLAYNLSYVKAATSVLINSQALTDIAVIVMAIGITKILKSESTSKLYQIIGHTAIFYWFYKELHHLSQGQAYVSVSWGLYAVAMVMFGYIINKNFFRTIGTVMIFVVVGKLLLIDLSSVAAIWRVLLFMGFGSILLLLSYRLARSLKSTRNERINEIE
jgi:uncharacterized membrane protein